jgi:hypothetical protein
MIAQSREMTLLGLDENHQFSGKMNRLGERSFPTLFTDKLANDWFTTVYPIPN